MTRWDPTQTPWCKRHWAQYGGSARASEALIGEFGKRVAQDGMRLTPDVFQRLLVTQAPICCKLPVAALLRIRAYGRQPLPPS
jgi:hypothetical protein